jgi:lysozyme family protein
MNNEVKTIRLPHLGKTIVLQPGEAADQATMAFTLAVEGHGGDPHDPGGPTNYGWTLATLCALGPALADFDGDHDVDLDDLETMSQLQAAELYKVVFWARLCCGRLPPRLACVLLDTAVNLGKPRAVKLLQRAYNSLPLRQREDAMCLALRDDGLIGPITLSAAAMAASGQGSAQLHLALLGQRRAYYHQLLNVMRVSGGVAVYPYRTYYGGWLNRCDDLQYYIAEAWA